MERVSKDSVCAIAYSFRGGTLGRRVCAAFSEIAELIKFGSRGIGRKRELYHSTMWLGVIWVHGVHIKSTPGHGTKNPTVHVGMGLGS